MKQTRTHTREFDILFCLSFCFRLRVYVYRDQGRSIVRENYDRGLHYAENDDEGEEEVGVGSGGEAADGREWKGNLAKSVVG